MSDRSSILIEPGGQWHDEAAVALGRDTLFTRQTEAFLDAVEQLRPPLCTHADAAQTLRVNLAILDSAAQGGWQTIHQQKIPHE